MKSISQPAPSRTRWQFQNACWIRASREPRRSCSSPARRGTSQVPSGGVSNSKRDRISLPAARASLDCAGLTTVPASVRRRCTRSLLYSAPRVAPGFKLHHRRPKIEDAHLTSSACAPRVQSLAAGSMHGDVACPQWRISTWRSVQEGS